jgi:hypothetical protein
MLVNGIYFVSGESQDLIILPETAIISSPLEKIFVTVHESYVFVVGFGE